MKKILIVILCLFTMAIPVYAENTNGNGNTTTGGNSDTTEKSNATILAEAREKRVIIKTQLQELKTLRTQLRTRIHEKQQIMLQYKEKEELTEEERLEVKEMIKDMKMIQEKLGNAYHNATKALNDYKKDASNGKLTGLDLVIESQKQRIALLEAAIEELE